MSAVTSLGLGKTMEKKLHSVGVHSSEELTKLGSKQAVFGSRSYIQILV